MNFEGKNLSQKQQNTNSSRDHIHSCSYSALAEQYVDEDLEELLRADMSTVRAELKEYDSDPDELLKRLFIDLDPKVVRISQSQNSEKIYSINYFLESFHLLQEAVLESLYTQKRSFWPGRPTFGVFASFVGIGVTFLFLSLWFNSSLHEKNLIKENIVSATNNKIQKIHKLSNPEKDFLRKRVYTYLANGGKLEPTDETNALLKSLAERGMSGEAGLLKAAIYKNGFEEIKCSNNGFYSYIVKKKDSLSSISEKCNFKYTELNEAKDLPFLHESDVIHFNFDKERNLTKLTIYKDNDFYTLDFEKGRFISKEMFDEEKSLIIRIDPKQSTNVYSGIERSHELTDKGELWEEVVGQLSKDYSPELINRKIQGDTKYFVSIKYRHDVVTNTYKVISTSLLEDKHGS